MKNKVMPVLLAISLSAAGVMPTSSVFAANNTEAGIQIK